MARMSKAPPLRPPGRLSPPMNPAKAVMAPPRIKPASTRNYGKGGTPYSGSQNQGLYGAGIGYGGPPGFADGGGVPGDMTLEKWLALNHGSPYWRGA